MSELALKLIKEAKKKHFTMLDLRQCGLTELPKELFQLHWLEEIKFSAGVPEIWMGKIDNKGESNKIDPADYEQLGRFKKLKKLDFTNMMSIDAVISDLSSLTSIKSLEELKLSCNYLTDLTPLSNLNNLRYLDLEDNQIADLTALKGLKKLKYLNLRNNSITDIAPLADLSTLSFLYLGNFIEIEYWEQSESPLIRAEMSENNFEDVNPLLYLKNLETLDLRGVGITQFTVNTELKKLTWLDLSANLLKSCPDLTKTPSLNKLFLNYNHIENINNIKHLTSLQFLDISFNNIENIIELKNLQNLQSIIAHNNKIKTLEPLRELKHLIKIDLSNNDLSGIINDYRYPYLEKFLLRNNKICKYENNYLPMLEILDLGMNELSQVGNLGDYHNLKALGISQNKIDNINEVLNLKKIELFYCDNNNIKEFPLNMLDTTSISELRIHNNPIINVPKYLFKENKNCQIELMSYWQDLKMGYKENDMLKVLLVGNGHVGKTSLINRITNNSSYSNIEKSTHGVNLLRWITPDQKHKLFFWDFGGQDIYYATHRIFMQTEAIFLLVWDYESEYQRKFRVETMPNGEAYTFHNYPLSYWLSYSKFLGKNSPVLVVQSKIDVGGHQKQLPQQSNILQKNYNIQDFLSVDNYTGKGINALIENLLETANNIIQSQPPIPESWYNVRQIIWDTALKQKFISKAQFSQICTENLVPESSQLTLIEYLHNSGVLFYKANYFNDQIILDQQWIIDMVYTILRRDSLFYELVLEKKGEFSLKHLNKEEDWRTKTDQEKRLILDFMISTQICFLKPNTKYLSQENQVYIAPQLLPLEFSGDTHDWILEANQNGYQLKIKFDFFHYGIIQGLIYHIASFENIEIRELWKTGIRGLINDVRISINSNITDGSVVVYLQNTDNNNNKALLEILKKIYEVLENETYSNYNFEVSKDGHEFIPINFISGNQTLKKFTYNGLLYDTKEYLIFLPSYVISADLMGHINSKPIIYISCAQKDIAYQSEIKNHLKIARLDSISHKDITLGEDIEQQLISNLQKSPIIICLISSDYLTQEEKTTKIERDYVNGEIDKENKKIIPIRISPVDIDNTIFSHVKYFPDDHWIDESSNPHQDYVNLVKHIKDVLSKIL